MTTLMDIKNEYLKMLDIVNSAEEQADGCVDEIDDQLYLMLDDVQAELIHKLESCAIVRDSLLAGAKVAQTKYQTWQKQRQRLEANAERLKQWMAYNMQDAGMQEANTNFYSMKFTKKAAYTKETDYNAFDTWVSTSCLAIEHLYEIQPVKPKKNEILKELKAGRNVPGFELIENEQTLKIK